MAKRKPAHKGSEGQTTSKKDTREAEVGEKPAKKKANTSKRAIEEKCDQLKCEICVLEGKRGKLSERELELEEQLRQVRHEVEEVDHTLLTKRNDLVEAENSKHLDKLPPEVWEKILDELDENDLFPLALSCRYFRQKQKELVARTRQSGPGRVDFTLALKTTLRSLPSRSQPASAEYLRFCSKEKLSGDAGQKKAHYTRCLAAFHGHLPLLQELLKPLETLKADITNLAARGGQLETLQWLKTQKGFKLDSELLFSACVDGHLDCLRWLRSEGCPWDELACVCAAQCGHLEVLKWLRSEGCPWDAGACAGAAFHGHFEILKWLRSEGCPWDGGTCDAAAEGGHLEVLKWLRSEGCPWDEETCAEAAKGGHLEVLKWLRSEGCPWNEGACDAAAEGGHLEVLRWLRSGGCPWNAGACAYAARDGHLEVLRWLRSEGCPWDANACMNAAWSGRLEILKWLRSEGCPWDWETCERAAAWGHLVVLKWAIDNGCPYRVNDTTRPALESLGLA